jgi:GYF domain 2/Domain of unknown function (DUF4190)
MASTEWFYGSPDRKLGPVDQLTLMAMARQHTINPKTLVWTATMPSWVPAGALPFLYPKGTGSPGGSGQDPGLNLLLPIGPQSGFSIAAGYLGLISLVLWVLGPLAIVFGILGLRDLKRHPEKRGTGRAITGIVCGSLTVLGLAAILIVR